MAGWNGADEFKNKAGGKGDKVPCMTKMFGIEGCPHCATASRFFDEDKEKEGRAAYWKKQLYGLVVMNECPDKNKINKIQLMNFPSRQVEYILKKVQDPDQDTRWPVPTDLAEGRLLVLSKDKGQGEFSEYGISLVDRTAPLSLEWWNGTKGQLVRVDNDLALVQAVKTYDAAYTFQPSQDMKDGDKVKFRLLPIPDNENAVPFGCIFIHYVQAPTPWDKAWAEVRYDPAREAEVRAKLGLAQASSGGDAAPGFGGGFPGGGDPGMAGSRPW